jgi:hypothetical protein
MGRFARSAKGQMVNFDELEIKAALSSIPAPISVNQRRRFINDKDGISPKKAAIIMGETANAALAPALEAIQDIPVEDDIVTEETQVSDQS